MATWGRGGTIILTDHMWYCNTAYVKLVSIMPSMHIIHIQNYVVMFTVIYWGGIIFFPGLGGGGGVPPILPGISACGYSAAAERRKA